MSLMSSCLAEPLALRLLLLYVFMYHACPSCLTCPACITRPTCPRILRNDVPYVFEVPRVSLKFCSL